MYQVKLQTLSFWCLLLYIPMRVLLYAYACTCHNSKCSTCGTCTSQWTTKWRSGINSHFSAPCTLQMHFTTHGQGHLCPCTQCTHALIQRSMDFQWNVQWEFVVTVESQTANNKLNFDGKYSRSMLMDSIMIGLQNTNMKNVRENGAEQNDEMKFKNGKNLPFSSTTESVTYCNMKWFEHST